VFLSLQGKAKLEKMHRCSHLLAMKAMKQSIAFHCGLRGFRWGKNLGCCVAKCAPHKALKFIARGKLTFVERLVVHRVVVPALSTSAVVVERNQKFKDVPTSEQTGLPWDGQPTLTLLGCGRRTWNVR